MLLSLLKSLLLPPALQLMMMLISLFVWTRLRRLSVALMLLAFGSLYLLSTSFVAVMLAQTLESRVSVFDLSEQEKALPELLIVLGAGRRMNAPEYGGRDRPSALAMDRLLYAASLASDSGIPLMVSGGRVLPGEQDSEAQLMTAILQKDFQLPVVWQESGSSTTWENATGSRALLPETINRILLVTHAMHMPRARFVFERAGFEVVPAPTGFHQLNHSLPGWAHWLPDSRNLTLSRDALHEWLGWVWYRLRANDF